MTPVTGELATTGLHDNTAGDIITSVGGFGPEHRVDPLAGGQHDRAYHNVGPYVSTLEEAREHHAATVALAEEITDAANPNEVTRKVTRFLTPAAILGALASDTELGPHVEAAIPAGNGSWMVYLGENDAQRPHVPAISADDRTEILKIANGTHISPRESISTALEQGVRLYSTIDPSWKNQLLDLWSGTFGWTSEQIDNLLADLEADRNKPEKSDRHFWFSASVEDDEGTPKLVGVAMAERIDMPSPSDSPVHFVESTEWRRRTGGKSRMTPTLNWLHAQVLEDLPEAVIYAECNETSGAYILGSRVHMEDSRQELAKLAESDEGAVAVLGIQNVLRANVYVDDGVEPLTPRDFVVLHLSEEQKKRWYSSEDRAKIINLVQGTKAT